MKTETMNQGTWIDFDSYKRVLAQRDELAAILKHCVKAGLLNNTQAFDDARAALAKLETEAK